jgi:hypothetical protein
VDSHLTAKSKASNDLGLERSGLVDPHCLTLWRRASTARKSRGAIHRDSFCRNNTADSNCGFIGRQCHISPLPLLSAECLSSFIQALTHLPCKLLRAKAPIGSTAKPRSLQAAHVCKLGMGLISNSAESDLRIQSSPFGRLVLSLWLHETPIAPTHINCTYHLTSTPVLLQTLHRQVTLLHSFQSLITSFVLPIHLIVHFARSYLFRGALIDHYICIANLSSQLQQRRFIYPCLLQYGCKHGSLHRGDVRLAPLNQSGCSRSHRCQGTCS